MKIITPSYQGAVKGTVTRTYYRKGDITNHGGGNRVAAMVEMAVVKLDNGKSIRCVLAECKPVRELVKIDKPMTYANHYWTYGDFEITKDYVGFLWSIKEWDLDDPRIGNEKTVELCVAAIEEWIEDNA